MRPEVVPAKPEQPDGDGYLYLMGRVDDVINVAGHRLSTGQMGVSSAVLDALRPVLADAT